jgi:hypothetical protein
LALRILQEDKKSLELWIDSICINQLDSVEKSSQVGKMGQNYSEAALVLSWLGPEDSKSKSIIAKLSKLGNWYVNKAIEAEKSVTSLLRTSVTEGY